MLERSGFMPVNYLKKESYTGSYCGMRFKMHKVQVKEGEEEKRFFASSTGLSPMALMPQTMH